jgi:hypothetical protein
VDHEGFRRSPLSAARACVVNSLGIEKFVHAAAGKHFSIRHGTAHFVAFVNSST